MPASTGPQPRRAPRLRTGLLYAALLSASFPAAALPSAAPGARQIDKPGQRRLQLQTVLPQPQSARLYSARVLADPRTRWRAMSDQAALIEAPAGGFPLPGQQVKAGQILAWLRPVLSLPERSDLQSARRTEQRDFELAQVQIRRFDIDAAQAIDISLPTPSMQIIADYHGAQARSAALDQALGDRLALRAPSDGVLLDSLAQSQRVAAAGDALFEAAGAGRWVLEVIVDDPAAVDMDAAQRADRPLQLVGISYDAGLRAWRAQYQIEAADAAASGLAVGAVTPISLPLRNAPLQLPRSSLFYARGRAQVWVHEGVERFEPRSVEIGDADEAGVRVLAGLSSSDRVVVDAARLLRPEPLP